jgi:hypothetical protein
VSLSQADLISSDRGTLAPPHHNIRGFEIFNPDTGMPSADATRCIILIEGLALPFSILDSTDSEKLPIRQAASG